MTPHPDPQLVARADGGVFVRASRVRFDGLDMPTCQRLDAEERRLWALRGAAAGHGNHRPHPHD